MSRYQDALDYLVKTTKITIWRKRKCTSNLCGWCDKYKTCKVSQSTKILQELVRKATPEKPFMKEFNTPLNNKFYIYDCPNCGVIVNANFKDKYCSSCGQHLDWSQEDE